jgi:hypothetical protein
MADQLIGSIDLNFTDSRKADPTFWSGAFSGNNPITNYAETEDITSLRTALNTFSPTTYTTAVLNNMNVNDLVFAWRACRGQQASISDYHPAQSA